MAQSPKKIKGIASTNHKLTVTLGRQQPTGVTEVLEALRNNAAARRALNQALDERKPEPIAA